MFPFWQIPQYSPLLTQFAMFNWDKLNSILLLNQNEITEPLSNDQRMTVDLQPSNLLLIIRHHCAQLIPKCLVVFFHKYMCQFMNYNIINHWDRCHDQTLGKIEGSVGVTRSPAFICRCYFDFLNVDTHFTAIPCDSI